MDTFAICYLQMLRNERVVLNIWYCWSRFILLGACLSPISAAHGPPVHLPVYVCVCVHLTELSVCVCSVT